MDIWSIGCLALVVALPILVLDFDGTIALGDGPVWAYADAALAQIEPGAAESIRTTLTDFLAGDRLDLPYADGYFAVADLCSAHLDVAQLDQAYRQSRRALDAAELQISSPPGLGQFLRTVEATPVLVTNAPADGVHRALTALGLDDVVDQLICEAGKPAGLNHIVSDLLGDLDPRWLMSVGDVYANDIAPILGRGCATAFINRFGVQSGPAHLVGTTFGELYEQIGIWAADPTAFLQRNAVHLSATPAKDLT